MCVYIWFQSVISLDKYFMSMFTELLLCDFYYS